MLDMMSNIAADLTTRADVGPRDRQQDRVRAAVNDDGSPVIGVPYRIGSSEEL